MDPRDLMALEEMAAGRGSIDLTVVARGLLNAHRQLEKFAARLENPEFPNRAEILEGLQAAPQAARHRKRDDPPLGARGEQR